LIAGLPGEDYDSFKEYHLEKFSINLEKYILGNEVIEEDSYYLSNNNNEYV